MKWCQKHINLITQIISMLFVFLFVYAAISKFLDFEQFKIQLGQSPIVTAYANWISLGIPLIELILSYLLLKKSYMLIALYCCYGLMIMFTTYIILILNFSDYIPCSCGGVLEKLGWTEHVFFNITFILFAVIAIYLLEKINKTVNSLNNEI